MAYTKLVAANRNELLGIGYMWNTKRFSSNCFGIFLIVMFTVLVPSCTLESQKQSSQYWLSASAFSAATGKLLFMTNSGLNNSSNRYCLSVWNPNDTVQTIFPIDPDPFDFAWVPGQDAFVVTHSDRISFFEKDQIGSGYLGTSISCPIAYIYMYCSWSPNGRLLAVNSYEITEPNARHKLALFDRKTGDFTMTQITTNHLPYVWRDNSSLFTTLANTIREVNIDSGRPLIGNEYKLVSEPSWFYGVFGQKPLILQGKTVKLGERDLACLQQGNKRAILATPTLIFVVDSKNNLIVFDEHGNEIARTIADREIRFGAVGEDHNTVYGISGTKVLRISVRDGRIHMEKVCDLTYGISR